MGTTSMVVHEVLRRPPGAPWAIAAMRVPGGAWAPVLVAGITVAAFWRSFATLVPLLGVDSPTGLMPVLPLLVLWLAAASISRRARAGLRPVGEREGVIDIPVAFVFLSVAAWLTWRGPQESGWYFWAQRLDLLAAVAFALGIAVLLWGVQTLWWHRSVALFALLIWPVPLLWLQSVLAQPLAVATAVLARPLAVALGTPLGPVGPDARMFIGNGAQSWALLVGDVCAGLNAGMAVALVSVPGAVQLGVPWRRAVFWALGGVVLALGSNVLRVAGLLVATEHLGTQVALGTVHPALGAVLLTGVFVVMWLRAPVAVKEWGSKQVRKGGAAVAALSPRLLAVIAVLAVLFGRESVQLEAFAPLPPVGPPGGTVATPLDYVRLPAGWSVEAEGEQAFQHLFGRESVTHWLLIRSSEGAAVMAQLVTTPDRGRLRAFDPEACRIYHGGDVVGRRAVGLDGGGVATLIDTSDRRRGVAWAARRPRLSLIYWEAPFSLQGRAMHARVTLIVQEADEETLPEPASYGLAPGGMLFDRADNTLVDLARGITREVVAATASAGTRSAA